MIPCCLIRIEWPGVGIDGTENIDLSVDWNVASTTSGKLVYWAAPI